MGGAADPGAPRPYGGGETRERREAPPKGPSSAGVERCGGRCLCVPSEFGALKTRARRVTSEADEGDLLDHCPRSSPPQVPGDSW